ncbi:putative pentatricopeptide repeat-containing protein At3g18840 [Cucurbita maxima]|uniref:Pentatricopeptide repeat-containing protein At3g18840 n=1 Tax=Cucurbita maxima TaxID=3661 RepID=A0A6J1I9U9_CUCMA|nr:putative pentatricopeptide repeat-containing protein At3g18840 [Cucurbita maxima]
MESSARRRINLIHRHLLSPPCEFNNALNPAPTNSGNQLEIGVAEPVIVGGMVLDIHAIPSISAVPRSTTPGKINYILGGVARNVAECMSKLGSTPFMISVVGHDMAGNLLFENWRLAGLSTEGIRKHQDISTAVVCAVVDVHGELAAAVASVEAIEKFLTPDWIEKFKCNIRAAPVVMVDANLSPHALKVSCQIAAEYDTPVWFEPVSVAKSRRVASVVKYISFTSPNEDELIAMANALSGQDLFSPIKRDNTITTCSIESFFEQLKSAVWVLLEKGVKVVILTVGSRGVFVCSKGCPSFVKKISKEINNYGSSSQLFRTLATSCPPNMFSVSPETEKNSVLFAMHFPALPASVVRLTGCGDCLVGGMLASICAGLNIYQSTAIGIAAAKAAVETENNVPHEFHSNEIAVNLLPALSVWQYYMQMKHLKHGLLCHVQAIKSGFTPTIFTSNQLISLYAKHGLLGDAHKVFDEMPERNVFSWNAIIAAYIKSQNLRKARELFDSAHYRDLVTYNSMLSGYVSSDGYEAQALGLFVEMQTASDMIRLDEFSLTIMLNLTAKLCVLSYGKQLHTFMLKTANDLSVFAASSLIDMYSKCGCFKEACRVYDGCGEVIDLVSRNAMVAACCRAGEIDLAVDLFSRERDRNDVVAWNTMISGFVQNGYDEESLKLFVNMADENVRWNEHTFASVLSACSNLKSLKLGKEIHAYVLKNGLIVNPFIGSGLVDVYCKCNNMRYAESVHSELTTRNVYSITSMIVGYSSQGNMVEARKLFDSLDEKNSVVWTALFIEYVKSQQFEAVFELLSEYRKEAAVLDVLILVSIIGACARQAALAPGKQIHGYMLRAGIEFKVKLASSLVDMYSKCGSIIYAERIFREVLDKDSILYNIMIAGYAHHGWENEAVHLFKEMIENDFEPDAITFIALLSACRHSGLVELGERFFDSMTNDYNISPEIDHYACMIDLYGRANELNKALAFMKRIPIELDAVIWGAFLNACRINGNTELAREAEDELLMIEGENGARYVQLANVYAAEGNWEEMGRIRKKMKGKDVKKNAGFSWVFVENKFHVFISGDRFHLQNEAIYSTLASLTDELLAVEEAFC